MASPAACGTLAVILSRTRRTRHYQRDISRTNAARNTARTALPTDRTRHYVSKGAGFIKGMKILASRAVSGNQASYGTRRTGAEHHRRAIPGARYQNRLQSSNPEIVTIEADDATASASKKARINPLCRAANSARTALTLELRGLFCTCRELLRLGNNAIFRR